MAVDQGILDGDWTGSLDDLRTAVYHVLLRLLALVAGTGWIVFWGLVTRLHVQQGQLLSAGVVTVLFILPAAVGIVYYSSRLLTSD